MFPSPAGRRTNRPVWVKVSLIFPQQTFPACRPRGQAVDVGGEVPGDLHGWYRTGTGDWLGLVSYTLMFVDRMPSVGLQLHDQLVPADALRPRRRGAAYRH